MKKGPEKDCNSLKNIGILKKSQEHIKSMWQQFIEIKIKGHHKQIKCANYKCRPQIVP